MTIDEAKSRLLNTAWLGTDEDRDKTEEAVGVLFDVVKAIEDIKAEIDAQIDLHDTPFEIDDGMDASFCDGLNKAKEIIDKYIAGKDEE